MTISQNKVATADAQAQPIRFLIIVDDNRISRKPEASGAGMGWNKKHGSKNEGGEMEWKGSRAEA